MNQHLLSHNYIKQVVLNNQTDIKAIALVGPKGTILDAYARQSCTDSLLAHDFGVVSQLGTCVPADLSNDIIVNNCSEYNIIVPLHEMITVVALLDQTANVGMMRFELKDLCMVLKNLE